MRVAVQSIGLVLCIIAILTVETAYPNGRQPPRSSDVSLVKATCEERSGGHIYEIIRARVTGGEGSDETLRVVIGSVGERMAIADIKTLTLPTAQVDQDGFIKATLLRSDGTEEKSVMVQVRSGKAKLRLVGFRSNGASVNIDLARCKTVEFSSAAPSASDSNDRPEPKK